MIYSCLCNLSMLYTIVYYVYDTDFNHVILPLKPSFHAKVNTKSCRVLVLYSHTQSRKLPSWCKAQGIVPSVT